MNKPLVERIDELRWSITHQRELSELDSILADVRELVEAAQQFRCDFSPAVPKDETIAYVFTVGQYNRLSAILRKVGGE